MKRRSGRHGPSLWDHFVHFFNSREPYLMRYDSHKLSLNFLYAAILITISVILYSVVDAINNINLFFIRLGTLLLLFSIYFAAEFTYFVGRDLRKWYHNLKKGHKFLLVSLFFVALIYVVFNQSTFVPPVGSFFTSIDYTNFNLLAISETFSGTQVVDIMTSASKSDMRGLVTFLPLSWGYFIFWFFIGGLLLITVISYVYFGEVPRIVAFLMVLLFIVMFFMYKVPYSSVETQGIGMCDERGNLVFDFNPSVFSNPCVDYRTSECRPTCLNRATRCQCEAALFDIMFRIDDDLLFSP